MTRRTHIQTSEHARLTVVLDDDVGDVHVYSEYRTAADDEWCTDHDAGISFDSEHLSAFVAALVGPRRQRTYEDERGDVLTHLRNVAQTWRNRANDQPGAEHARGWIRRAEELGRLANEIERGAHVAAERGNWRVVRAKDLAELKKATRTAAATIEREEEPR